MKTNTKYIAITVAACASILLGARAVEADATPSPVKAFQDLPTGYSDIIIIAGCIGANGWYTNQASRGMTLTVAQLTIVQNDRNCIRGGALNP